MKKIILIFLVISPALLYVSCGDNVPVVENNPDSSTDVRWTNDWKFVTVYLDGAHETVAGPTPATVNSRAMTPDTARRGFDFFEVIFVSNGITAKTYWEIGRRTSVYEVPRTPGGVDYSRFELSDPYSGSGQAALLFAGRKRDKTLLAVGKVYSVDDVVGTVVTSGSSYVTFELFSLKASVNTYAELSCFTTAYDTALPVSVENTRVIQATIGGRPFPLYKLPPGKASVLAEYKFEIDGAEWDDFAGGMVVGSVYDDSVGKIESGAVTIRNPRYPAGNGYYWYPIYPMDITTTARMLNNQKPGWAAENPIKVEFNTLESTQQKMGLEIGLFTFAFRIPVRPLMPAEKVGFISPEYDEDGDMAEESDEIMWFIRPAYQSYYYNIDNGTDSTGGGVLMGAFGINETELEIPRKKI